ncbi:MAG TPA: protein kinase [Candidatus Sulfopaludibacter sp.]|jgi:Tol biopolymer transport system component|nr:protein kinase [Candidatus Sulfopaludibacter sp.]
MSPRPSIAHYQMLSKIGEGGMGEVWRALDTKLNREVAVKLLPESFASDAERLARFTREAQVLAALNHPNIAAIYGVEDGALILELVDGETPAGPLSAEEALPLIHQLIDGLEYAHEKAIVHRDLKPANLKLTADRRLKVLDFGLAKAMASEANVRSDIANSPTMTMQATMAGVIMGTAAYMSPEQARGQTVDKRSDIWSFGVVVYELLTGRQLFQGETVSDVLAAVLRTDPDLKAVPPRFHRLLRLCLTRDPRQRLRDISGARLLLEDTSPLASPARSRVTAPLAAIAILATAACAALAFVHFREQPAPVRVTRFEIAIPDTAKVGVGITVSPDGRSVAFLASAGAGARQIWLHSLDSLESHPLPGTDDAGRYLAWSPDSSAIVFTAHQQVKKISVSGGAPQILCSRCPGDLGLGWSAEGVILKVNSGGSILRMEANGSTPVAALPVGPAAQGSIQFLPGGRHFLYAHGSGGTPVEIAVASLDETAAQSRPADSLLAIDGTNFVYAPDEDGRHGYIVFQRGGLVMAQRFDGVALKLSGRPVSVVEGVGSFSAAGGVLAYRADTAAENSRLVWLDRGGRETGQFGPPGHYADVKIARDGKTVAVDQAEGNTTTSHSWIGDLARGTFSRPIQGDTYEVGPVMIPDGRVAFTYASSAGKGDLYITAANGAGTPSALVKSAHVKHSNDVSPDGRFLIYDEHNGDQRQDLQIVPLTGAPGSQPPVTFLATRADETFGQFSPDGKFILYASDEAGSRAVYVRDFIADPAPAAGSGKWLISSNGGGRPRWNPNGKEILYIGADDSLMSVPYRTSPQFEPGIPVPLFKVTMTGFAGWDVAADGRFLINIPIAEKTVADRPITVVLNWTTALREQQ